MRYMPLNFGRIPCTGLVQDARTRSEERVKHCLPHRFVLVVHLLARTTKLTIHIQHFVGSANTASITVPSVVLTNTGRP